MARTIPWYHYAMPGLQSLKKDRFSPQDPRGSRLRVGLTQSTCLLVGALILGASGAMGDDISTQNQLDAAISAGSNQINITAGNLALSGSQSIAPTADLTVATGASLSLSNVDQTVGSLSGGGTITLGTTFLTAGGNNNSTAFSGTLQMTKQGYDSPPLTEGSPRLERALSPSTMQTLVWARPTSSKARWRKQVETPQSRIWLWARVKMEALLMLVP